MKHSLLILIVLGCFLQASPAQSAIFLVRHAEKADTEIADAKDPDLSVAGRARAAALAAILKDAGITAIYATEYRRTQQTAEPLAALLKIDVTIIPAIDLARLIAKLKETTTNVLVVGHSNTVPEIAKALGISAPIVVGEVEYDNLFMVVSGPSPQLIHLHYP